MYEPIRKARYSVVHCLHKLSGKVTWGVYDASTDKQWLTGQDEASALTEIARLYQIQTEEETIPWKLRQHSEGSPQPIAA